MTHGQIKRNKYKKHQISLHKFVRRLWYKIIWETYWTCIWVKVFQNGPSQICGRQPLKNFTWSFFEHLDPFVHCTLFVRTKQLSQKQLRPVEKLSEQMFLVILRSLISHPGAVLKVRQKF